MTYAAIQSGNRAGSVAAARLAGIGLTAAITAAGVVALLFGPQPGLAMGRTAYVLVASTGFLAAALAAGAGSTAYGRRMLLGLFFCWWGDVLGREVGFEVSAASFFLAHLAFIAGFATLGLDKARMARTALAAVPVTALVFAWLAPHLAAPDYALVLPYVIVITLMVICAGGTTHARPGWLALAGGAVFFISDIFVARWRFVGGGHVNGLFCYPLYYTACLCLAASSVRALRGTH
jgi:uncharacterized membrane protein YhhN